MELSSKQLIFFQQSIWIQSVSHMVFLPYRVGAYCFKMQLQLTSRMVQFALNLWLRVLFTFLGLGVFITLDIMFWCATWSAELYDFILDRTERMKERRNRTLQHYSNTPLNHNQPKPASIETLEHYSNTPLNYNQPKPASVETLEVAHSHPSVVPSSIPDPNHNIESLVAHLQHHNFKLVDQQPFKKTKQEQILHESLAFTKKEAKRKGKKMERHHTVQKESEEGIEKEKIDEKTQQNFSETMIKLGEQAPSLGANF